MNTLIKHIEYLVSRHDCVTIPNLGAFICTHISAGYDTETQSFHPPYREISFNGDLRHNDGMLAASIQRAESISYDAAMARVNSAVDTMLMLLAKDGRLGIGALGTLTLDKATATISYQPASNEVLCGNLWFTPIKLDKLETTTVLEAPIKKQSHWTIPRAARTAASIAVLLAIGFVASTPIAIDPDNDKVMLASLAPEVTPIKTESLVPEPTSSPVEETDTEAADVTEFPATELQGDTDNSETPTQPLQEATATDYYYVIVGTFKDGGQADKFIAQHSEDGLKVLSGKYHWVYASAHTDADAAMEATRHTAKTYPGAWIRHEHK